MNPLRLRRVGIIGTLLTALCCFTPVLGLLLGTSILAAWAGYLDLFLLPLLAAFVGLTFYAHRRCRRC